MPTREPEPSLGSDAPKARCDALERVPFLVFFKSKIPAPNLPQKQNSAVLRTQLKSQLPSVVSSEQRRTQRSINNRKRAPLRTRSCMRRAIVTLATAAFQVAARRTTIRGHAVRRVDGLDNLWVYAVAYGGGDGGAPHDALATQLWPSARIAASLVADAAPSTMVEIGCGLALPSLAAAQAGVAALATDRDAVALEFVSAAAADQNIDVATRVFDVEDASSPLPPGDLVVLADVFVTDRVAEACAVRCEEALGRGSDVLVVAAARSTRDAFLRAIDRPGGFGPAPARLDDGAGLWLVDGGAG